MGLPTAYPTFGSLAVRPLFFGAGAVCLASSLACAGLGGSGPDAHGELLAGWFEGTSCETPSPLCGVLAAAGSAEEPAERAIRIGVALECVNSTKTGWPSQLRRALEGGFEVGVGVMGLHLGEGQPARMFTIQAETPAEQRGLDKARQQVARCLERPCKAIGLDADLHAYLGKGASTPRSLTRDPAGHLLASRAGDFYWAITYAVVDGQGWWLLAETRDPDSSQCEYLNVFPDVDTRVKAAR